MSLVPPSWSGVRRLSKKAASLTNLPSEEGAGAIWFTKLRPEVAIRPPRPHPEGRCPGGQSPDPWSRVASPWRPKPEDSCRRCDATLPRNPAVPPPPTSRSQSTLAKRPPRKGSAAHPPTRIRGNDLAGKPTGPHSTWQPLQRHRHFPKETPTSVTRLTWRLGFREPLAIRPRRSAPAAGPYPPARPRHRGSEPAPEGAAHDPRPDAEWRACRPRRKFRPPCRGRNLRPEL
jgi:hypothetical protein